MKMLDLSYLYPFQKNRYEEYLKNDLQKRSKLSSPTIIKDGILLPPKPKRGKFMGNGCVCDSYKNPVRSSFMIGINNSIHMGGSYDIDLDNIKYIDEEVIYLGYLSNHWGHFLMDFSTRLWYAINNPGYKLVYLIRFNDEKFVLHKTIKRFFELLGIDNNICTISQPTRLKQIIIPEQSYVAGAYCSQEYLNSFRLASQAISPTQTKKIDKVFFSRAHIRSNIEIGTELIEQTFHNLGFTSIFPEEESLDNQIYYVQNAREVACVSGTLVHNLLFSEHAYENLFIINKHYYINDFVLDEVKILGLTPCFLDFYAAKYPTREWKGPFIFVYNNLMKKFIKDRHIKTSSFVYSQSYLQHCLQMYEFLYVNKNINEYIHPLMPVSNKDKFYYPLELYKDFIESFQKFQFGPKEIYQKFKTISEFYTSYNKLNRKMMACEHCIETLITHYDEVIVSASIHISNHGWLEEQCGKTLTSDIYGENTVEAIRLKLINTDTNIYYQIYYDHEKWSEVCFDYMSAGTTGKAKPLQGIKVWLGDLKEKFSIQYRIYIRAWSEWVENGIPLFAPKGFKAFECRIVSKDRVISLS